MESIFYFWIISSILAFLTGLSLLFDGSLNRTSRGLISLALILPSIVMLISFLTETSGYPFIYSVYLGIVGVLVGGVLIVREREIRISSRGTLSVLIGIGCLGTLAYLNYYFSTLP